MKVHPCNRSAKAQFHTSDNLKKGDKKYIFLPEKYNAAQTNTKACSRSLNHSFTAAKEQINI